MTGEQQAKRTFESLFGWCWVCGATLTKDENTLCIGPHRRDITSPFNSEFGKGGHGSNESDEIHAG